MTLFLLGLACDWDWRTALVHRQEDKLSRSEAGEFVAAWKQLRAEGADSASLQQAADGAVQRQCASESWSYDHYRLWSMIEQERFASVAQMHADPGYLETKALMEWTEQRGCTSPTRAELCAVLSPRDSAEGCPL